MSRTSGHEVAMPEEAQTLIKEVSPLDVNVQQALAQVAQALQSSLSMASPEKLQSIASSGISMPQFSGLAVNPIETMRTTEFLKGISAAQGADVGILSETLMPKTMDMAAATGHEEEAASTFAGEGITDGLAKLFDEFQNAMGDVVATAQDMLQNGPELLEGAMVNEPMLAAAKQAAQEMHLS